AGVCTFLLRFSTYCSCYRYSLFIGDSNHRGAHRIGFALFVCDRWEPLDRVYLVEHGHLRLRVGIGGTQPLAVCGLERDDKRRPRTNIGPSATWAKLF